MLVTYIKVPSFLLPAFLFCVLNSARQSLKKIHPEAEIRFLSSQMIYFSYYQNKGFRLTPKLRIRIIKSKTFYSCFNPPPPKGYPSRVVPWRASNSVYVSGTHTVQHLLIQCSCKPTTSGVKLYMREVTAVSTIGTKLIDFYCVYNLSVFFWPFTFKICRLVLANNTFKMVFYFTSAGEQSH